MSVNSKHRGRRRLRLLAPAVAAVALWVALPAGATPGSLTYEGCVSSGGGTDGCDHAPGDPLAGVSNVAVSPDGKSVYVASYYADTVTHFFAGPTGRLVYNGCISDDGSGGECVDAPGAPLDGAYGVAVSPDGKSVYVASSVADDVTRFSAAPAGQISYDACISDDGSGGNCVNAPGSPLDSAADVAVSPNGKSVYVTGTTSDDIAHFFAGAQGQLTYDGCVSDNGSAGTCVDAPGAPLGGATGVAVSPNGGSVYVASIDASAITHFFAASPNGQLTYDGCISDDGSGGNCVNAPGSPLHGSEGVAVSPDGKSVYAASGAASPEGPSNAITHFFAASPNGQLTYDDCISGDGSGGCVDAPGPSLDSTDGVVVSPDGNSVFATSGSAFVTGFSTAAKGQLTYDGCVSSDGSGGDCGEAAGAPTFGGSFGIAMSPDGNSLYATTPFSDAVLHFYHPALLCDGKQVTEVGTNGKDKLKGTKKRDVIDGLGGSDTIKGLAGDDVLCGNGGSDVLRGNGGKDKLFGGPGKDKLVGGPGRDHQHQ